MKIEVDDLTRREVIALLEEHLSNMYELGPPETVFALETLGHQVYAALDAHILAENQQPGIDGQLMVQGAPHSLGESQLVA